MKLPSLQTIIDETGHTIGRFPLAIACAFAGTIAGLILIDRGESFSPSVLYNVLFAALLGFPLFATIALVARAKAWRLWQSAGLQVIALLALIVYAFMIPSDLTHAPAAVLLRQLLLALALVLLAMVAPFTGRGRHNGFWQYNKVLFFRLLTAVLFSFVLFLGLSVALAALDNLFGMDIPGKRYGELWSAIAGFFAPLFFLSGVPENLDALDALEDYPRGLRVFAQYILAPLVIVYLIILYAYIAKIIGQWNWPQGWVSRLILGFSATGIFALALLYPIRERAENRWIKSALRWFWIVILPLVVVLVLAIWRRVSEYGLTESRYIGIALALWLAAMAVYFIFSRTKSLKIIPASLCVLAMAISFGPWGVFHVSEQSQVNRLQRLLETNHRLVDNRVTAAGDSVGVEDTRQINAIIAYLNDTHGYAKIQSWFGEPLTVDSLGAPGKRMEPSRIAELLGIEYVAYTPRFGDNMIEFACDRERALPVGGYQHLLFGQFIHAGNHEGKSVADSIAYRIDSTLWIITVQELADSAVVESLQIDLHPLIDTLMEKYGSGGSEIPPPKMMVAAASGGLTVAVHIRRILLKRDGETFAPDNYVMDLLYSKNK
ncbi:MAG: DUF4153 domain-containing protein [candidate division Zixibacteria bacterium]|nr:DUF4153 domain-containing protein [candidate division Zixibacteria bacterium]